MDSGSFQTLLYVRVGVPAVCFLFFASSRSELALSDIHFIFYIDREK